ncbi:hypothetical protein LSG31_17280 [Fodinisporobacter ferrooxydans]|uniref:Holin n=1 Tax=Fodinisporobacter ferrooxydans TaxID=2901836 RepID=A0ABY4CGS7_9BACL|nr:hypothetical protein LSG31_17280 [Alicyclobacillaceae bacterium MYW30-H2]
MLTGYMLYSMWAVLGLIALDILTGLYRAMISNSFSFAKLASFLGTGILNYVLPLLVLAKVQQLDPTSWVVALMYYLGALGVVAKYLTDISSKLKK